MEQADNYRHELKFAIPYPEYAAMRARLRLIMKSDPHVSENGTYQIRSIYFDNSDDKALREKIDGIGKREKFRIRYYNDDFSFIVLEKKMKNGNLCSKLDEKQRERSYKRVLCEDEIPKTKTESSGFLRQRALHISGRKRKDNLRFEDKDYSL